MGRKFFVGGNWKCNGTTDQVKKIVTTLNEAEVPSEDDVEVVFVGDKVAYALSQGLKVIACVGETLKQRESGSTMAVVAAQTKAIAERVTNWSNIVLAYEPVWAIGTGKLQLHFKLRKFTLTSGNGFRAMLVKMLLYPLELFMEPEFVDIIMSATAKKNA